MATTLSSINNAFIDKFFNDILRGESKTYNDYNYYDSSGLHSWIEGRNNRPYGTLTKPLSEYTIGEIKVFQANSRQKSPGQLFATGRYQIIPNTLKGQQVKAGLTDSDIYNKTNQDKLGLSLIMSRKTVSKYIKGEIENNQQNLEKSALDMAMIWSSLGVPYNVNNKQKNQSYYSNDRASVDTSIVQKNLQEFREEWAKTNMSNQNTKLDSPDSKKKSKPILIILIIVLVLLMAIIIIYRSKIEKMIAN